MENGRTTILPKFSTTISISLLFIGLFFSNGAILNNHLSITGYISQNSSEGDSDHLWDRGVHSEKTRFLSETKASTSENSRQNRAGKVLFQYDWQNDVPLDIIASPPRPYPAMALEDSRYLPYFEQLVTGCHELFTSPINLVYENIYADNGEIRSTNAHVTWGVSLHNQLNSMLWMYGLTGNVTYKQWADDLIEGIWSTRSTATDLIPREVDATTGSVIRTDITHYDMAGWLNGLELAYYFSSSSNSAGTGQNTYFDLINKTASAIARYFWYDSANRWIYKRSYSDIYPSTGIPEMNAFYVDYAMIRAYEITGVEEFVQKAITDFDVEFMGTDPMVPNGVLMHNSLVIHSPSTFGTQSSLADSSNIMVARTAYLIYLYTRDAAYLAKAAYHYRQMMSKHRFEKGYATLLRTDTLEPYDGYLGYNSRVFDRAPIIATLAVQNTIIPSAGVFIDWGYGLSTSLPTVYGFSSAYTGVNVNINQQTVELESVDSIQEGTITINFGNGSIINKMEIDGVQASPDQYNDNVLLCDEGVHSYRVFFTAPQVTGSLSVLPNTPSANSKNLSIYELYLDAKYAWDKLQLRRDVYGPVKTGFYFETEVSYDVNMSYSIPMVPVTYAMYKITGDHQYLDAGWKVFQDYMDLCMATVIVTVSSSTGTSTTTATATNTTQSTTAIPSSNSTTPGWNFVILAITLTGVYVYGKREKE
ncbi:MAG: hypothetical protein ACFFD4_02895 [Candidatus Odinarchaeota archaeon]